MKLSAEDPCSLMEALQALFPNSSKRSIDQWIKWGRILVDGAQARDKHALIHKEQEIKLVSKPPRTLSSNIKLLYQDRYFVCIDKPAKLLSVPSEDPKENDAKRLLEEDFGPLYAVHRLDRDASGVLLFARGKYAEKEFEALFESRTIKRTYFAILEGRIENDSGHWDSYLAEQKDLSVAIVAKGTPHAKQAITHYQTLHRSRYFSYLLLQLETGRKHQIRVHAHAAGHPIVGDKRYSSSLNPIGRLALHALYLDFVHPFTKKPISLHAALPAAFQKLTPQGLSI